MPCDTSLPDNNNTSDLMHVSKGTSYINKKITALYNRAECLRKSLNTCRPSRRKEDCHLCLVNRKWYKEKQKDYCGNIKVCFSQQCKGDFSWDSFPGLPNAPSVLTPETTGVNMMTEASQLQEVISCNIRVRCWPDANLKKGGSGGCWIPLSAIIIIPMFIISSHV